MRTAIYSFLHLPEANGRINALTYPTGYSAGYYRADLLIDKHPIASSPFVVGHPNIPQIAQGQCHASNTLDVANCSEGSVLRIEDANDGGSGFVIRSDATGTYVLTNRHVVTGKNGTEDDPAVLQATSYNDVTQKPTSYLVLGVATTGAAPASIDDLAVLRLAPTSLRPLRWGNSQDVRAGQDVVSLGYQGALAGAPSLAEGPISDPRRDVGDGAGAIWLQHEALSKQGNSGGPLLDLHAQAIGVNTFMSNEFFYSIPENHVRAIADRLIRQLQQAAR